MKKIISSTASIFLALVFVLSLVACNAVEKTGVWESATYLKDTSFGDGAKTLIVEVKAAKAINKKNTADQNSGIAISLKMKGSVSKISVGPCVGSNPLTLNTAGKITIPDSTATKKVINDADHAVVERFVPFLK